MAAISIDRTKWSKSSQKSFGLIDPMASTYESINYHCKKCQAKSEFSAEAQKFYYETRKKFVMYMPTRCVACERKLEELISADKECQKLWNEQRETLRTNIAFLKKWLSIIQEIHTYGKHTNETMVSGILRLLRAT